MNIYDFSAQCLHDLTGTSASTKMIQRVVGTLRSAGFGDNVLAEEVDLGKKIIADSTRLDTKVRTASTDDATKIEPVSLRDKFSEMIGLKDKGLCPRCKSPMATVKLSTYEPAYYCAGCRTTLWVD